MGALPRPDLAPGPQRAFVDALHDLHHRAGWPSLRTLARDAGCSHTTVSNALSSPRLPAWGIVELLVESMAGDVAAFHDLWLAASSPSTDGDSDLPRIAGRGAELIAVRRHLTSGTGLLLVTGEAGMGKTKLVTTATHLVAGDCFVATGSCLPLSATVPLLPIADALQSVFDADDGQWFKEALADSAPYVAGSIQRLVPDLERRVDAGPQPEDDWSRHRLFSAVAATVRALAATRPLALALEDLHWADAVTLDLVEHLSTRGPAVPVLASYRIDDPSTRAATADWLGRVRRLPHTSTVQLVSLSEAETALQLSLLLGRTPDGTEAALIHARSAGLPLFTEQLAGSAGQGKPLPALLADLLDSRLLGLGARAWAVARVLGVADRALPAALVGEASGLAADEVTEGLRELDEHLLLARSDRDDIAQLRHPLLAEAIRRRLVPGEAADQHRRLAASLATAPDPVAAEIATHWQRAGCPDAEVTWRVAAARAAGARFASHEEIDEWRRAIELYRSGHESADGPDLFEVYIAGIDATWEVGFSDESALLSRQAMADLGEPAGKAKADLLFRAGRTVSDASSTEASEMIEQSIEMYRTLAPGIELAQALLRRSSLRVATGSWDDAAADLREAAILCAAIGEVPLLRRLRAQQAWQEAMLGHRDLALAHVAEACRMQTPHPDPTGDNILGVLATDILLKCGGSAADIVAAASQGFAAVETWGVSNFASALLRGNVSEGLTKAGDVTGAAAIIDPVSAEPGFGDLWPIGLQKANLDAVRGFLDEAAERLGRINDLARAGLATRLDTCCVGAVIDLWRGRASAALRAVLDVLDAAAASDSARFAGPALVTAARAAADLVSTASARSRGQLGRELDGRLRHLHSGLPTAPFGPGSVLADALANERVWRAELARLAGTATVEDWVATATEWDKLTRPHDAAYCRWRAAEVAHRVGQGTVATRLLNRAARDAREHVPLSESIGRLTRQCN